MKLGKILKGALRIVDNAVLGGVITNKRENNEAAPAGSFDHQRLIGQIIAGIVTLVFLYLLATGKISFDEFKQGVELF